VAQFVGHVLLLWLNCFAFIFCAGLHVDCGEDDVSWWMLAQIFKQLVYVPECE
jgi:hypothetical protein